MERSGGEVLFFSGGYSGNLTESTDVKQYIKRIRSRDAELNSRWGTICTST